MRLPCVSRFIFVLILLGIAAPPSLAKSPTIDKSQQVASTQDNYILGSGDQIEISVFGYPEFTGSKTVLPDGTISLPVVGSVMVADRTPTQLAAELRTQLNAILVEPTVTVSLTMLRPVAINIAGEVQRPGAIQLQSLNGSRGEGLPTLSIALMQAGGVTQNADIRQVVLRRALPGGQTQEKMINLWDAMWSDRQPEDLILRAGDAIYVPKLAAGATLDRRLVARSRLSPTLVKVRVVGEVNRPGELQISPDSSLSSAIANAGGFSKEAKSNAVQLVRLNDAGQVETQPVDLSKLNDEMQVREGDVLIVPEKKQSSFLRNLGRVLNPLGNLLGIFRSF